MGALEGIKHIVVLMLENRSFDCMLGQLYPDNPNFEGLGKNPGAHYVNPYQRPDGTTENYPSWNDNSLGPASVCIPDPDPGELFTDMNVQLFGKGGTPNSNNPPPMNGFVENYMQQSPSGDPMAVMHYFTPMQVPIISQLAKAFGVCDQWHASAPCQTWPNRFFVHSATCDGHVNNADFSLPYTRETIFKRLRDNDHTFRIYYHDIPQTITLRDILEPPFHFHPFSEFLENAHDGDLPDYSFIEPRYFTDSVLGLLPNDEHPPHNVVYGEQLIADVYNAVRNAPTWKQTLLVITYDEHGGCYDHMPPPKAVPPEGIQSNGNFSFDRYGVRVPAVIISPYMPPGSIVRAAPDGLLHEGPPYPFDHTSIIATLRNLFDLGPPLTGRDAVAPDLLGPLSLQDPTNDGPVQVTPVSVQPSAVELAKAASLPPNHMQEHLCRAVAALPEDTAAVILPTAPKPPSTGQ